MQAWQRRELRDRAEPLVDKLAGIMGVRRPSLGIKRMKTRWGSCNPAAPRIWLNLELAKKAPDCIEYLVVHELAHLIEPNHGERFIALMDRFMPRWRIVRDELNAAPLAHEEWDY
jgi:predicted metal-dependent hydrolase